jgi:hypothetical protein
MADKTTAHKPDKQETLSDADLQALIDAGLASMPAIGAPGTDKKTDDQQRAEDGDDRSHHNEGGPRRKAPPGQPDRRVSYSVPQPSLGPPPIREPIFNSVKDADRDFIADINTRQSTYLAASGTLTQFNAIMAAIHGTLISSVEAGLLKTSSAAALLLHVLAAFILCWAARPTTDRRDHFRSAALFEAFSLTDDTFRNYRRGWRMTLLALLISSVAMIAFLLHAFGISISLPANFLP